MTSCIGEPVSYFRLERYSLHELPAEEDRSIAAHLEQCAVCRACYERIHADARDSEIALLAAKLSQLPAAAPPRRARWMWGASALVASLAALLFVMRPPAEAPGIATQSTTKGDGLGLEVVRADAQGQLLEPTHFADGDRFKFLLSCPGNLPGSVRVLVFQGAEAFEPVPAQRLESCGNRRPLAGAWAFEGAAVEVCAVFADAAADLSAVRSGDALQAPHVCARLEPVAR